MLWDCNLSTFPVIIITTIITTMNITITMSIIAPIQNPRGVRSFTHPELFSCLWHVAAMEGTWERGQNHHVLVTLIRPAEHLGQHFSSRNSKLKTQLCSWHLFIIISFLILRPLKGGGLLIMGLQP